MAASSLTLNSGHSIPQLGLGTWLSQPGEVGESVKMALEVGYRHIDCATVYQNQEEIGKVFSDAFRSGKVKREDVFITSKIWNTHHSYEKASEAIGDMLKDLQVSYLDLCLIHWPMGYQEGNGMFPVDKNGKNIYSDVDYLDTWKALENAVKTGKIRNIGVSNFNIKQLERILDSCTIKPQVVQVEAHPYFSQNTLLDWCKKHKIVLTAFCPLANNAHVFRKEGDPNLLEDNVVLNIAKRHNKTSAQVVLRWAVQRGTSAIPKSIRRTRLEENYNVFDFELTTDEMNAINNLDRNWRIAALDYDITHPHYPF